MWWGESIEMTVFLSLLLILGIMLVFLFFGWLQREKKPLRTLSPYSKKPVRYFSDISFPTMAKVRAYMLQQQGYDNRMFGIYSSVICRETGRVFPDCVKWWGGVSLDWTFLHKRYPGSYVSWGSLDESQQRRLREIHNTLEGFQTEDSCPNPLPQNVTDEYIYLKPGPLYVNINTGELLGWKCVPETYAEVLIVQKPSKPYGA